MSETAAAPAHPEVHHDHPVEPFWRRYIFSVDHKVIGIQYGITSLIFLLFGYFLMVVMRWQLGNPGAPLPIIEGLIQRITSAGGESWLLGWVNTEGKLLDTAYNKLGAMHGTIMIFLGVVPLGVGAFGNYLVPIQVGAADMAFPRLNMASYWIYFIGGVVMLASFFPESGPVQAGWTNYPPLASITPSTGQIFWL